MAVRGLAVPSWRCPVEHRRLGQTGLSVSVLGFGCGAIGGLLVKGDAAEQRHAIERALEAGVSYFDTAPLYGEGASETNLGRAFAEMGGVPPGVIIGTKVRVDPSEVDQAPESIRTSVEASLRRLRVDHVPLLQLHTSITAVRGRGVTPADALGPILDGFRAVREAGLATHLGFTANGDTDAVREVMRSGAYASGQAMVNALNPSAGWSGHVSATSHDFSGLIADAIAHDVGVIVIRSLAAGALATRDERHANAGHPGGIAGEDYANDLARSRQLASLAVGLGLEGPAELSVRLAQSTPGVGTVIVGFSDMAQLDDAIRWTARGSLSPPTIAQTLRASVAS
jgi:aryl-alcohol dehydrogenase-like predicted oxidoreductase